MNRGRQSRAPHSSGSKNVPLNDSIGNRQFTRQTTIVEDGVGNRALPERQDSVISDSLGNSVDLEPTHMLRGGHLASKVIRRRNGQPPAQPRRSTEDSRSSTRLPAPATQRIPLPANRPSLPVPQRPKAALPVMKKKAEPVAVAYTPDSQVQRLIYLSDIFSYPLKLSLEEKVASSTLAIQQLLSKVDPSFQVEVRIFTQEQPLVCFFVNEPGLSFLSEHAILFAFNYLVSRIINRDAESRIWFIVVPHSYEQAVEESMVMRAAAKDKPAL